MSGAHWWLILVVANCAIGFLWWRRGRAYSAVDRSLEVGYRSLIRGFLFWSNLPWLAMGLSILLGLVPSTYAYLEPGSINPFVQLWWGIVVAEGALGTYWIYFRGGAEMLIKHPGLVTLPARSPSVIKLYWMACLAAGALGLAMLHPGFGGD